MMDRMQKLILIASTLFYLLGLSVSAQAHWFRHAHPTNWDPVPHGVEHKHYDHKKPYRVRDMKQRRVAAKQFRAEHKNYWRKMKNFRFPSANGNRVDFCYNNNHFCGRSAANAYCRSRGYRYASQFKVDRHALVTQNLGDKHINYYPKDHGNGFTYIRCRKHS